MDTTPNTVSNQASVFVNVNPPAGMIALPSCLKGFRQTGVDVEHVARNEGTKANPYIHSTKEYRITGFCESSDELQICPECGAPLHRHGSFYTNLRHVPIGGCYSLMNVRRDRYRCSNPECKYCKSEAINFKSAGHMITKPLKNQTEKLLSFGLTLKEVSHLTGLHKNIVKDIDKARLEKLYTELGKDGTKVLIKPETQARYLGIDEFKLHDGYRFATQIMDMETGCILWLQAGKKKKVVYDFIEHVGLEWMSKVEAVSSDMNSDFSEAFLDKCPHLKIVYDYFHIVKNFNDKVVSAVRKDEQKRLIEKGDIEGAKSLQRGKYILMSNLDTLRAKDEEAKAGKVIRKGSELFKTEPVERKDFQLYRRYKLTGQNWLLFQADYVRDAITTAYRQQDTEAMRVKVKDIISYCRIDGNEHFMWFARLLENHLEGIVSHAKYPLSNGKVEGVNQKIKTIRRKSYGLPDDEYFFLKLFDATRQRWKSQIGNDLGEHKNLD